ncbi:MAG: Erythronate-4-phosphate dehydrogenase [Planctomycetes bacterium ADurb.Bin401]|nr:MAG: Erythronate-4-phosphate dehydrogenase [Planctomycetes bacterium ADurb.Bin401]
MKIIADENIPFVKECFISTGDVATVHGRKISKDILRDADALLVRSITKVNKDLLEGTNIKFVATATIGFEHIDIEYLKSKNIGFASAPGSNANSVAEYVTSALLNLAEKYNFDISKKSIGIVGVGNVGSRVEKKAKALRMKVVLNDPPLQRQTGDKKYSPLKEIFDCDIVTLHTPLTREGIDKTYHLADDEFYAKLKNGAIFFNTCRGSVHETAALKKTIISKKLTACVLDVWENEPDIDLELLDIVDFGTPHIAGYSYDGKVIGMIMIYQAFCRFFGLEAKFTEHDFLPPPKISEIIIQKTEKNPLLFAVNSLYDIRKDDENLRKIKNEPADKRGLYFDSLRKNYHVRREFPNTKIVNADEEVVNILEGIGYR